MSILHPKLTVNLPREFDRDVYPQGGDFDRTFDLPQVDLMNSRVEYVRAAEQGTKSRSGQASRELSTCLA